MFVLQVLQEVKMGQQMPSLPALEFSNHLPDQVVFLKEKTASLQTQENRLSVFVWLFQVLLAEPLFLVMQFKVLEIRTASIVS